MLKTRYASLNVPSTVVVAKSPIATLISSPPGFARSRFDHRGREIDAVHANAALRERQRDAAGADPELERGTVTGQVCEEVDDGIDRFRAGDLRSCVVVARGDALAEVILRHA